jgi:hypothetical protein
MRDRSYLTPMGQVVVGGVVLIACFAFQPLFVFVLVVFGGRFLRDLARRSASGAGVAVVLLVVVGLGLAYLLPASGMGAVVMGATLGWLRMADRRHPRACQVEDGGLICSR